MFTEGESTDEVYAILASIALLGGVEVNEVFERLGYWYALSHDSSERTVYIHYDFLCYYDQQKCNHTIGP
jgi:hypothetical protein